VNACFSGIKAGFSLQPQPGEEGAKATRRRWGGWVWPPPAREQAFPATGAAEAGWVGIITSAVGNPQERLATAN